MKNLVVIGQGYVGLPLAQGAVRAGMNVIGLDLSSSIVDNLNAGQSHIDDLPHDEISEMLEAGYRASTDPTVIRDAEVVVICVPTPLGEAGSPDLKAVIAATESIAKFMTTGTLVVLESTTYPGTTQELCQPILEGSTRHVDEDFYLAFSPERIDPGNKKFGLKNTPKVVGGVSIKSTEAAVEFYSKFVDTVVPTKSAREAETAKLLENTYRHINIALVNEMSKFCHELNIDLWDVIAAAKSKPFGFQAFYPGPGVGGHCIPIDPNYLSYQVRRALGYPFRFVELAEEINNSMPRYVGDRVQSLLNDAGKPLKGSKVLLLGVTYKANISDQRESPAVDVAEVLLQRGAEILFHDPMVQTWSVSGTSYEVADDIHAAVLDADVVVLLQNHDFYDVDVLSEKAEIFFDTRGASSTASAHRL
ncbi:nucleotide sugar dehydrogenase [Pseudarthrobacter niigatensis]|uniref:Nucleotide sugar dehydrogenase n=1 Tax=Pseudarthrobacter niigatensis TaxID=369935 RepID=A0AAJ1WFL3_9MICC|nr:nucleotide sugar dehydrogenase [Pseudarthrobacter niigatensis]MDQ0145990.1 nucleotide sugar dehydrogenase [Pseudarthrobacter niigatensis]MDQ0266282.1 nucleotide sugar dehydrogenase [Pseudarthrobacter niigatensis]